MASSDDEVVRELQNIGFLLGDLNYIRNGHYNPPGGSDPDSTRVRATPDDIYDRLGVIVSLLERQNTMLYNMGLNAADNEEYWSRQNRH